jgi:hypothetical protein
MIELFINTLTTYEPSENVFNPWLEYTDEYDIGNNAPKIRVQQLDMYLRCRIPNARYFLVAEALDYQGGVLNG